MLLFKKICSFVWISLLFDFINCDYFSSMAGLELLLSLESSFMDSLDSHIQKVEIFNKEIQSFLEQIEVEQIKIQNDRSAYFEDPINAFKAIKRFSIDWRQMEDFTQMIQASKVFTESSSLLSEKFVLPTEEDLSEAGRSLVRLQHFYKYKSEDIAKGQLGSYISNSTLTCSDCFVLGQKLYDLKEYFYASEWLIMAMQMLEHATTLTNQDENNMDDIETYPDVTHITILELLGPALYNAGNPKLAQLLNAQLLAFDPENKFGLANKHIFEEASKEERRLRL